MSILIIAEKPSVAERIANSLGNVKKLRDGKVSYFEISNKDKNNEKIYVCSAVGHLYGIAQKGKEWDYPIFDVEWKANYEIDKDAEYTKDYINTIKNLSEIVKKEKNSIFINSCDYDIEGEVIGYNAIKFACGVDPFSENVKRMKFSTLTKEAILKAYKNLEKTNEGLAYAGMTRHILDWFWGINLTKALSSSLYKVIRKYQTVSIGRVQGPTLKILVDKEREIKNFVPQKYWEISMLCKKDEKSDEKFSATHKDGKIFDKEKAFKIKEKCKLGKDVAIVEDVKKRKNKISPPPAFDLTDLQTEAYSKLKIDPRRTLELAQDLYTSGIISYPRTASNQLTDPIDYYLDIILKLSKNYEEECKILIEKSKKEKEKFKPNNGKKTDPAHPAIHPTGEDNEIEKFSADHKKLYDLIVRRFLSTFGDNAIREIITANLNNNNEIFIAKGARTIEPGWTKIYKYVKFEEEELPSLEKGEKIYVEKINMDEKETQPPKRYTVASIIEEMERRNLGTKATRANIVDILFTRKYLKSDKKAIEVTPFGITVVEAMEKHCSEIISENLTRKFEEYLENIQNLKISHQKVIDEAKKTLTEISNKFKKEEFAIGKALFIGMKAEINNTNNLSFKCPKCGGDMMLRNGPYGNFAGCNNYPNCKFTVKLPPGNLKVEGECKYCKAKMIIAFINKKRIVFCPNPECPSKKK